MKHLNISISNIKFLIGFFAATIALSFSACQTITEITAEMSGEEAVETIHQCLAGEAGGFVEHLEDLIIVYNSTMDSCALTGDTTITRSSTTAPITYSYASTYAYTLNCTSQIPSTMSINLTSSGNFDAPKVSSNDNTAGPSTLGNLPPSNSSFEYDGSYSRNGTMTSKIRQKGTFTFNFSMQATDVMINKTSQQITSGTATFSFAGVGTSVGAQSYNYAGTITFHGGNSATITLAGQDHIVTIN